MEDEGAINEGGINKKVEGYPHSEDEREALRKRRKSILHGLQIQEPTPALKVVERWIGAICEDPRRVWMDTWGEDIEDRAEWKFEKSGVPECGTVACARGWLCVVVGGNTDATYHEGLSVSERLVGIRPDQSYDDDDKSDAATLFRLRQQAAGDLHAIYVRGGLVGSEDQGTYDHAERAACAIEEWAERWHELLRGVMVDPIPRTEE